MKALALTLVWTGVALALPGLLLSGVGMMIEEMTEGRKPC